MAASACWHIFIPGLFAPLRLWQQDFGFTPLAPELLKLLAGARLSHLPVSGPERTLLHQLGLPVQRQLPWAQLRYRAEVAGGTASDSAVPVLLCADPVYWRSGSDSIVMAAERPQISVAEAESLVQSLNEHLAQDGLRLTFTRPQHWYLQTLASVTSLAHELPLTTPPSELVGGHIFPGLPQTTDKYWQRLLNELQMLLHSHPLNQQREQRGLLPVNALWFWGEGRAAAVLAGSPVSIQGGGINGEVVAYAAGCPWHEQRFTTSDPTSGQHWVIIDDLLPGVQQDQPDLWQAVLNLLAADFAFLQQQLQQGAAVQIYDMAGRQWQCHQRSFWSLRRGRAVWGRLFS